MAKDKIEPLIEEMYSSPRPETAFKNIKNARYSFFLDSASAPSKLGRFSILGFDPFLVFKAKGDHITLEWQDGKSEEKPKANPFFVLKDLFKRYGIVNAESDLPFVAAGGVGYFAYDMKSFIERLPDKAVDDLGVPDCVIGFYDAGLIYDNLKERAWLVSTGLPCIEARENRIKARARLEEFKKRICRAPAELKLSPGLERQPSILKSNFSKSSYMRAIDKAKAYIKNGDIYQVNLSQRFEAELAGDPFELYLRLRAFSPAPFSSYLNFGELLVLSSSPERFLRKIGRYIETRPIKGTRPRGEDALSDETLAKELVESAKDRAEHIMIVDLERNDLGRICEYGSVRPTELFALERYSTVFHLVSTVSGRLRADAGPIDCLLATFPGGSITGAPKIRSMEIIDELEPVRRSIYTGAVGYISFSGDMDTSIVIRTFIIKGKKIYFQVGGGIVADSNPEEEYYETIDKARGLMRALGIGAGKSEGVFV